MCFSAPASFATAAATGIIGLTAISQTTLIRTVAFTLAAFTAGIGGIVYASRLRSMSTSFDGGTIALYVVASAAIAGTSMFGGRGSPLHPVLGGIVIAGIVNGIALLGLPAAIQLMATAVVLIVSILIDVVVRRRGETTR